MSLNDRYLNEIETLQEEIQIQRRRGSIPRDVQRVASLRHQEIEQELETILMEDGFEDFVVNYLNDERSRLKNGKREDLLCDCGRSSCPIKQASIPSQVRLEDSFGEGLLRYKHRHPGTPHGLIEARTRWIQRKSGIKSELQEVLTAYSSGQVSPRLINSLDADPESVGVDAEQFSDESAEPN